MVAPVGMVAIEVSNEHGRVGEHREYIGAVPSLTGGFIDIGDMITTDTNDIAEWSRQDVSCFGDVTTYIGGSSIFGMQRVAHKVETRDGEAAGYVSIHMGLLKTDDVDLLFVCDGTDDTSLGG